MGLGDRLCFRLRSRFSVFYRGPGDPRWVKAFSTDLSTSGMGILTRQAIEKDSEVDLRLGVPGHLKKITLRGRVVHQIPVRGKSNKLLLTGIRFEEFSEKVLDMIVKFILKRLRMTAIRTFALLTGLTGFAALLFRFLYYSSLKLFQGTAFGKEWLAGIWETLPSGRIAYFYAAMAVLILVASFCFFFMRRRASRGILVMAAVGLLDQGIRCFLKIPYLLEGLPSAWIFLGETGLLVLWGTLLWAMIQHGGDYEQLLGLIQEDVKFKPVSPDPPSKEIPPPVDHVFLP